MAADHRPRRPRPAALVGVLAAVAVLGACGSAPRPTADVSDPRCPHPPDPDPGTVSGLVGYIAAHPDDVAVIVDDGRGATFEHQADTVYPLASAGKALNMVAYAREVGLGHVDPNEPVRIGDWERWSVKDSEQSHVSALDDLGIPRNGTHAADPNQTVTIDQLANKMIKWSDNAAPDYLRDRLGDQALLDAGAAVGWKDPQLPSTTGFTLSLYYTDQVPLDVDVRTRRAAEWDLARRYAYDPTFRAEADARPSPPQAAQAAWAENSPGGTAREIESLWSAVGHLTFPGADRARAIGEQKPDPFPGVPGRGLKGGSLLGVLTSGIELRRDDGTIGTASVLIHRMSEADTDRAGESPQAFTDMMIAAVRDPAVTEGLRCGVGK